MILSLVAKTICVAFVKIRHLVSDELLPPPPLALFEASAVR